MLVSLHLPKTTGISFAAVLDAQFGSAVLRDYGDFPLNTPHLQRHRHALEQALINARDGQEKFAAVRCIHGHFLPVKYLLLADVMPVQFVTWMRDPVQRMVSQYHFWLKTYQQKPADAAPLHRRIVEESWSLEQFCLSPEMQNVYGQFFWGFGLERFDFIGITEHYDQDLADFDAQFLRCKPQPQRLNVNQDKNGRYELDPALLRRIEDFRENDMRLYQEALALRQRRQSQYPKPVA